MIIIEMDYGCRPSELRIELCTLTPPTYIMMLHAGSNFATQSASLNTHYLINSKRLSKANDVIVERIEKEDRTSRLVVTRDLVF